MATILLAWEFGTNLGHVSRCAQIARALVLEGHRVLFALRDTAKACYLDHLGCMCLQAPLPILNTRARAPINFADMLLGEGYADPTALRGVTSAWVNLLHLTGTDVLVADHAPTALMAAQLSGVPHLAVGNGFSIPPATDVLPSIRPWEDIPVEQLQEKSIRLQEAIDQLAHDLGSKNVPSLADLFGATCLIDSFAELDHYGVRQNANYIGPIFNLHESLKVPWMGAGARRVIAYLRADDRRAGRIAAVIRQMKDVEALIVIPGAPVAMAKQLASQRIRIARKPVDLSLLLPMADLMISHGGAASVTQALLFGVPQLLIPLYVEQRMLGGRIIELGAGAMELGASASALQASLEIALRSATARGGARAFQDKYAAFDQSSPISKTVAAINEQVRRSSPRNLH